MTDITVIGDYLQGHEAGHVSFDPIPAIPLEAERSIPAEGDELEVFHREIEDVGKLGALIIRVTCKVVVRLLQGHTVLLQNLLGDSLTNGGPLSGRLIKALIDYNSIAEVLNIDPEDVERRLIVFSLSAQEAPEGMPIIPTHTIAITDLACPQHKLPANHPLAHIHALARKSKAA